MLGRKGKQALHEERFLTLKERCDGFFVNGEVVDPEGHRYDIALKGSGRTPFSRGGDGKAAMGPVLREYLFGEAMHALGIPTSRALAAVATGQSVHRERALPGAVLTRVANSHIRVGTFEFFAARHQHDKLKLLADYTIDRHFPELKQESDGYLGLLRAVTHRQATLISQWMNIGFIHGVMNTDNTAVGGQTIDFGPCAWLETYRLDTVFSSIDHDGRYAFGNQPNIVQWNLARFAETLLHLIAPDDPESAIAPATEVLKEFEGVYREAWLSQARLKLGLLGEDAGDDQLVKEWLSLLETSEADYTNAWRALSHSLRNAEETELRELLGTSPKLDGWLVAWKSRVQINGGGLAEIADAIDAVNPLYVPRNHLVEAALEAAVDNNDLAPFKKLLQLVSHPFDEQQGSEAYTQPASGSFTACYKTFCGT